MPPEKWEEWEEWLRARRKYVILALLALSIAVRAAYYPELSQGPCLWAHRWTESDNFFFDRWAKEIAGGDWLTNQELHPMVSWNYAIAKMYFARHPEKVADYQPPGAPPGDESVTATALWNRWFGGKTFHQEPLYPYTIALTYRVMGEDVRWVFAWQMALGVATNLLLWDLSRRYFGHTVAAVAGAMVALYAPLYYLELTLVRTTLLTFLAVAIIYLAERALRSEAAGTWLRTGIVFGIGILGQTTLSVLVVATMALLVWQHRAQPLRAARLAIVLMAGVLLAISPAVARNLAVGAPAFSLVSNGSMAFIGGLDSSASPEMGGFNFRRSEQLMEEYDARSFPILKASVASHGSIMNFAWLLARKIAKYWQWYEEPDNQNFYYFRLYSVMLRWSLTAYLLAPLMLVGLALAARRFEKCALLYALAASGMAVALVSSPVARYRAGYLGAMIPFAAFTLVRIMECARARDYRRVAAVAAAVLLAFAWTSRPLPAARREIRTADYLAPYYYYWIPEHTSAAQSGQPRRAAALLADSLRHEPDEVRHLGPARSARDSYEKELAQTYSQIHAQLAQDLLQSGDMAGASREKQRAAELEQAAHFNAAPLP